MEGTGLKFTPVVVKHLLGTLSMCWAYGRHFLDSWLVQAVLTEGMTNFQLPFLHHQPLPPVHPLIYATCDITVAVKKLPKIQWY